MIDWLNFASVLSLGSSVMMLNTLRSLTTQPVHRAGPWSTVLAPVSPVDGGTMYLVSIQRLYERIKVCYNFSDTYVMDRWLIK